MMLSCFLLPDSYYLLPMPVTLFFIDCHRLRRNIGISFLLCNAIYITIVWINIWASEILFSTNLWFPRLMLKIDVCSVNMLEFPFLSLVRTVPNWSGFIVSVAWELRFSVVFFFWKCATFTLDSNNLACFYLIRFEIGTYVLWKINTPILQTTVAFKPLI